MYITDVVYDEDIVGEPTITGKQEDVNIVSGINLREFYAYCKDLGISKGSLYVYTDGTYKANSPDTTIVYDSNKLIMYAVNTTSYEQSSINYTYISEE